MKTVEWFFDFVSPYSYFQCEKLSCLPQTVRLEYKPVLFAGLLNHWGHKGPVEIDAKRKFTFRSCIWIARRDNIPFNLPRAHPFNPLSLLRLSIALDNRPEVVRDLFRFVWREGKLPDDVEAWSRLIHQLDVPNADELIRSTEVKQRLRDNTDYAIEKGVFGVPTFRVDGEIFWGVDLFDFFLDYLNNPDLLKDPEMQRVDNLPVASTRPS